MVTNLATGAATDLGPFTGNNGHAALSWSAEGTHLAVEDNSTLAIADPGTAMSLSSAPRLPNPPGCTLADPVYLPTGDQLATVETCRGPGGSVASSRVVVIDASTGMAVTTIVAAGSGSTISSLSVPHSGQHALVGVASPDGGSATIDQVVGGRLKVVSTVAPAAAVW